MQLNTIQNLVAYLSVYLPNNTVHFISTRSESAYHYPCTNLKF